MHTTKKNNRVAQNRDQTSKPYVPSMPKDGWMDTDTIKVDRQMFRCMDCHYQ